MNFKKTWKRANEGFTLVELIVVIAILAILAGVAVPAYSGYIKKANKAADMQVLAAVNTAFAAAAMENGDDLNAISDATLSSSSDGMTIQGVANVKTAEGADATKYSKAFERYLGDGYATMKVIPVKSLDFVSGVGFVDPASSSAHTALSYKGNTIYVSNQAMKDLQNSTYGQTIGAEPLLNEIGSLVNLIGTDDFGEDMLEDRDYLSSLASYMGITVTDDMDNNAIMNEIDKKTESFDETQSTNMMFNGLVYYAADTTTQMTSKQVTDFLTSGNVAGNLGSDNATKLANASMAYGMYTAFVNSDYYNGEPTSTSDDPMGALKTISGNGEYSADFTKYVTSAQGQADLQAYMSAMSVINDSTGNDATVTVLGNGFNNDELVDLMKNVLGK